MSITIRAQQSKAGAAQLSRRSVRAQLARWLRTLKGQFTVYASLTLLLAATLTITSANTFSRASNDLATINSGSIPSVDAAQQITQLIEEIDAQSADFLATAGLSKLEPCTINGTATTTQLTVHACDERNIDANTVLVNQQLFTAMHNVTYAGEQTTVERISIGLESYLGDIHQMRVDYDLARSKTDPNDPSLRQAYQAYMDASAILHNEITLATITTNHIPFNVETHLPTCTLIYHHQQTTLIPQQWTNGGLTDALDCLSDINHTALTNAFQDSSTFLGGATTLLVVLCILLCGLLLFGTGRMIFLTHRLINPGLFAAMLLALFFSINSVTFLGSLQGLGGSGNHTQDGAFTQMVSDDYNSVYYTALLKRYATDANADESRWLIAQEFNDSYNIQHWQEDWNSNIEEIYGLMLQAHDNQTWTEELQPLHDMDTTWSQYDKIDGQIRNAANTQNDPHRLFTAESLSTGESNRTFDSYTTAIQNLSEANRAHYFTTFEATNDMLTRYLVLSLLLFPLVGLLAAWGVWLRLKDF